MLLQEQQGEVNELQARQMDLQAQLQQVPAQGPQS